MYIKKLKNEFSPIFHFFLDRKKFIHTFDTYTFNFIMRIKYVFLILACVLVSRIVAQTADVSTGCAPLAVKFTSPPGHPKYHWDFGNVGFSDSANASRTFTAPGTYTVTLTEGVGGLLIGKLTITVFAKPVPKITTPDPTSGCVPLVVHLLGGRDTLPSGVTINSYVFDYGDGTPSETTLPSVPVTKTYVKTGKFTVSLVIQTSLPSCNTTLQFPNYISTSTPPATSFTTSPDPPSACAPPLAVSFTNTTPQNVPLSFIWKVATNPAYTGATPPPITLTTLGNYTVTLTATDSNKCSQTAQKVISIGKPKASFTGPKTVCLKAVFALTNNSSGGSYSWDFGPGASPATSTLTNPIVVYNTPGVKNVKLTVSANGCSNDTTVAITVEDPVVNFTANPIYSCNSPMKVNFTGTMTGGTPGTWSWLFNDDRSSAPNNLNTSTLQNPTHTFRLRDSLYDKRDMKVYPVQLIGITAAGCRDTVIKNDTLFVSWARFVPDKFQGCVPLTVAFADSSKSNKIKEPLVKWEWDFGDGTKRTELAFKDTVKHTYTNPGTYLVQLIVTNKNGCKDTSYQVKIEAGDVKALSFTASPQTVCPGDSILLTNTTADKTGIDGWHYSSNGDLFSHCADLDVIKVAFNDSTGIRDIILSGDYNGCVSSSPPVQVNIKGPIAKINFKQTCGSKRFEVELDNFNSRLVSKYSWDFGDSTKLDTDSYSKITHTYTKTGDYKVVLTGTNDTSGCPMSVDSVIIHIRDIQSKFTMQKELCIEKTYTLDASASIDVNAACFRGYSWIFSDSLKRPITNASPKSDTKFASTGDQTISLVVEDINGCKDTSVVPVKVFRVTSKFSVLKNPICLPATVNFKTIGTTPPLSVSDTTIASWSWTFGDGKTLVIPGLSGDTSHVYTATPKDTTKVSLKVTDVLGCTNTFDLDLYIYRPTSSIAVTSNHPTFPPNNICLGEELTLNASDDVSHGSHLTFEWNMMDGSSLITTQSFKYIYTKSGTFPVTLKFTEAATGCTGNLSVNIRVQDYPKAAFTSQPSNLAVLCYPRIVNFTDSSITTPGSPVTTWHWDFGNTITADGLPNASTTFPKGTFTVKLVVGTSFGCMDSTTKSYTVVGPEGDYTVTPTKGICRGDEVSFTVFNLKDVKSYIWDFGDGSKKTETVAGTIKHTYAYVPPSGKISVFLILQDVNQVCELPIPVDLEIHNVKADFMVSDDTPCKGSDVLIKNMSLNGDTFQWTLGDNTTSTANDSIIHQYTPEGKYTITLITKNDSVTCADTVSKTIQVLPLPVASSQGDSICPDKNLDGHLTALPNTPGFKYSWSPTTYLDDPNSRTPTAIAPKMSITYTVSVTDTNNCVLPVPTELYLIPPISDLAYDTVIVIGDTVYLPINNQGGAIKFTWAPTEGLSCLQCTKPYVHPLKDIVYNVTMSDIKQCSTGHGVFNIRIKPTTFIKVPTTFTPNGDGNNDIIYVKGWGIKDLVSFQIFNRWGELVFETSDINEGWNGFYKDVLQNNDIYTYKVVATMFTADPNVDTTEELQGHISLMR